MLFLQVPVQINDSRAVLFAHKHAKIFKKTDNSVAVLSSNFLRLFLVVCVAYAVVVVLLSLRDSYSAVPDGVLHADVLCVCSSDFNNTT